MDINRTDYVFLFVSGGGDDETWRGRQTFCGLTELQKSIISGKRWWQSRQISVSEEMEN